MSVRKDIVKKYIEAVCRGDHRQILSFVTEGVMFDLYGHVSARGRQQLASVIDSDTLAGPPRIVVDRMIEEGDSVVVTGDGEVHLSAGGRLAFLFCDVFTFSGDAISRVESYQVSRGEPAIPGPSSVPRPTPE